MDDGAIRDPLVGRLTGAAEHFYAQFLARFSTIRDVKPETVIACSARMAGTMLHRAFDDPNAKCPKLADILFLTLHTAGHSIGEENLDDKDATSAASQLSLSLSRQLLEGIVLSYCKSTGLGFEDAAYALAVTTGLFVNDCRTMLDVRNGAAIAVHGFSEGCTTDAMALADSHAT